VLQRRGDLGGDIRYHRPMLVDNRLSVLQMYPGLGYVLYILEQYTYQSMHLHMIWPDRSRLGLKKKTLRSNGS
jgi:hypothetical protein